MATRNDDDTVTVTLALRRRDARLLSRFLNGDEGLRNAAVDHLLRQRKIGPEERMTGVVRALGVLAGALAREGV